MIRSYFQFIAHDAAFNEVRRTHRRRSRSFVQGFLKIQYGLFDEGNIGTVTITDIDGASITPSGSANSEYLQFRATGAGRSSKNLYRSDVGLSGEDCGIVLGTGTTAVAPTDFQLATQILDGTSSGKLEYFPSSGTDLTVSNPTGSFTLERLFRNSSGGLITVNEVGVYASSTNTNTVKGVCIIRDIVSPGFGIANGEYARVIYTISVTA
jgi:hypothetical protein